MTRQESLGLHELIITSPEQIPTGQVAFHGTRRENARRIIREGFDPFHTDKSAKPDEQFLVNVARDEGLDLPVNRMQSSFLSLTLDDADGYLGRGLGTCVLVVDVSNLSNTMCVADCHEYDRVISWTPFDRERAVNGPYTDEEKGVARTYIETMEPFNVGTDVTPIHERASKPELIVEGSVPASAVCGVIKSPLE